MIVFFVFFFFVLLHCGHIEGIRMLFSGVSEMVICVMGLIFFVLLIFDNISGKPCLKKGH